MSQAISISEIVRPVSDNIEPKPNYEQRVVINADTGQPVPSPNVLEYLFGNFRYYIVANTNNSQKVIAGRKLVKYREGNEELVFVVDYKGGCPPGSETQLAQFFFKNSGADRPIGEGLGKWLIEFFSTDGRKIDQFYSEN